MENEKIFEQSSEEFNLGNFTNILLRRKLIVVFFTLLGFVFSLNYARKKIPIYEGGFQIVLEDEKKSSSPFDLGGNSSPLLSGLTSSFTNSLSKNLKTEVSILKSSSVLKPVYKYIIKNKYNNDFSKISYKSWLISSLDIKLVKGTSVLEINYFDSRKDLIKPVLDKISEVYQSYSGKEKREGLKKSLRYSEEQLEEMKIKSRKAIYDYQKFALENSLGNRDGLPKIRSGKNSINKLANLEDLRIAKDNETSTRYNASYMQLMKLENEYLAKSSFLKPNSEYLNTLKLRITNLEKALSRPREVLLRHRELKRKAERGEEILSTFENQVISLKLQIAQQNDPWELISETTIIDKPVSPNKKQIVLYGLSSSFIFSILLACFIDRLGGLIYTKDYFEKNLKSPFLFSLPSKFDQIWDQSVDLFFKNLTQESSLKGVNFLILNPNVNNEELIFCDYVRNKLTNYKIIASQNISELNQTYKTFVICSSGSLSKNKLSLINQQINLMTLRPEGWIYMDKNLKI